MTAASVEQEAGMVTAAVLETLDLHPALRRNMALVLMVERNYSDRQAGTLTVNIERMTRSRFDNGVHVYSDDLRGDHKAGINYGFLSLNETKIAALELTSSMLEAGLIGIAQSWPGTAPQVADRISAFHSQMKNLRILAPGHPSNRTTKYRVTGKGSGNDDISISFISLLKLAFQFMTLPARADYAIASGLHPSRVQAAMALAHTRPCDDVRVAPGSGSVA
mgnify:CR=1 FL=1